jgi:hypothetical protein
VENLVMKSSLQLVIENLLDFNFRHLMVITNNIELCIQTIEDECQEQNREVRKFYGSDFIEDKDQNIHSK